MLHLHLIPLVFALVGLAFYTVLGGADFGAGFWQLTAGKGRQAETVREHAHAAMAPVWEANHVWLIFVLTFVWTAYPTAFGSIASTLSIPLFIAAVGIVFRGVAYALRAGAVGPRELNAIDTVFSLSSVLTPFALGAAVGGIASGRVPVGNAAGSQFSSWLNPTTLLIGVLAVTTAAYLAAVFLCADATKLDDQDLEEQFRRRALGAGLVAGAIAFAGLGVIAGDAERIFRRLTTGAGLPALVISLLAGVATLALVWRRHYELARYSAAVAVAAIIARWALAQSPVFLPGLTIRAAAAPRTTLIAVIFAVLGGAVILFPSLALLFRLVLGESPRRERRKRRTPATAPAGPGIATRFSRTGSARLPYRRHRVTDSGRNRLGACPRGRQPARLRRPRLPSCAAAGRCSTHERNQALKQVSGTDRDAAKAVSS